MIQPIPNQILNLEIGISTTFLTSFLNFFFITDFSRCKSKCIMSFHSQSRKMTVPVRISADKLIRAMSALQLGFHNVTFNFAFVVHSGFSIPKILIVMFLIVIAIVIVCFIFRYIPRPLCKI